MVVFADEQSMPRDLKEMRTLPKFASLERWHQYVSTFGERFHVATDGRATMTFDPTRGSENPRFIVPPGADTPAERVAAVCAKWAGTNATETDVTVAEQTRVESEYRAEGFRANCGVRRSAK